LQSETPSTASIDPWPQIEARFGSLPYLDACALLAELIAKARRDASRHD
jgi:hypothetical protein